MTEHYYDQLKSMLSHHGRENKHKNNNPRQVLQEPNHKYKGK